MDKVRTNEMQTLDSTTEEISLAIAQLGKVIRNLNKERVLKERLKSMDQEQLENQLRW